MDTKCIYDVENTQTKYLKVNLKIATRYIKKYFWFLNSKRWWKNSKAGWSELDESDELD